MAELGSIGHDPRIAYKRLVPQADELYRKYRWQLAPEGPYENVQLFEMATNAQTLKRSAHKAYNEWCALVTLGFKVDYERNSMYPGAKLVTLDTMTPYDLEYLITTPMTPKSMEILIDCPNTIITCARRIDVYHRRIIPRIDTELLEPKT